MAWTIENAHEDGSDHEDPDEDFDDASDDDSKDYSDEASAEDVPHDVFVFLAMLENIYAIKRHYALLNLGDLNPASLAPHAGAVVARLEDSNENVRQEALVTLGKLEPAKLAEHAGAVVARLEDSDERVRARALDLLRGLPRYVSEHHVDIFDSRPVRSRLLSRLGWYRCRLRLRVQRLALYWYALPYRPSGPGHARDVEAWEQMNTE